MAPLPYRFDDIRVVDERSEKAQAAERGGQYWLDQDLLVSETRKHMTPFVFGSQPAHLKLKVTLFEPVISHTPLQVHYRLILGMDMVGLNGWGEVIGRSNEVCVARMDGLPPSSELVTQAWQHKDVAMFTRRGKEWTMWQLLFRHCVAELSDRFDDAIVRNPT